MLKRDKRCSYCPKIYAQIWTRDSHERGCKEFKETFKTMEKRKVNDFKNY